MRAWLLLLGGCGWDLAGRWNVDRVEIGGAEVLDAGFVDLGSNNNHADVEAYVLLAYWYDLESGEFVPDPTPALLPAPVGAETMKDEEDPVFTMPIPVGDEEVVDALLPFDDGAGRSRVLEDPDWVGGPLVMEISR